MIEVRGQVVPSLKRARCHLHIYLQSVQLHFNTGYSTTWIISCYCHWTPKEGENALLSLLCSTLWTCSTATAEFEMITTNKDGFPTNIVLEWNRSYINITYSDVLITNSVNLFRGRGRSATINESLVTMETVSIEFLSPTHLILHFWCHQTWWGQHGTSSRGVSSSPSAPW